MVNPINPTHVGKKQGHKPPRTGNGRDTNYKNGDDWGMAYDTEFPTRFIGLGIPLFGM